MKLSKSSLAALAVANAYDGPGISNIVHSMLNSLCKNEIFTSKYSALYGACVNGTVTETGGKMTHVIPHAKNVQECIAGCRSYQDVDNKIYGFPFAGLGKGPLRTRGKGPHCFCGDEPDDEPHQFGDLFVSPVECSVRCRGTDNKWQRCGGHKGEAVSVYSVPTNGEKGDLGGICAYFYESGGQKFPFADERTTVTGPGNCREHCRAKGFG